MKEKQKFIQLALCQHRCLKAAEKQIWNRLSRNTYLINAVLKGAQEQSASIMQISGIANLMQLV